MSVQRPVRSRVEPGGRPAASARSQASGPCRRVPRPLIRTSPPAPATRPSGGPSRTRSSTGLRKAGYDEAATA